MEQTLQGVAFPNAAAAKAELLHSHDTRSPHLSRPKAIERPWMGFGDGKDMVKAQDQMMKRKRGELTTASTISVVSATGSETTARSGEEFELGFLRHDGHFEQGRKKGPVVTFVKQYFQEKWSEHTEESGQVSKNNRLEYAKSREKIQPMSKIKRWGYATTTVRTQPLNNATAQESQLVSNSKRLEHTTTREDTRPMSKKLHHVAVKEETRSLSVTKKLDYVTTKEEMVPMGNSKRLDHATAGEETKLGSLNKRLAYEEAMEERDLESRTKRLDYAAEKEETKPVSWSKRMDYATENEETESTSWSKRLDYATEKEEPLVSKSKRLEYVVAMEETNPTLSKSKKLDDGIVREETELVTRSKRLDYAIEKEETQMSKSKRLDNAVAMEETKPMNKSKRLDYVIVNEDMEPISRSRELEDPLEDDETQPMSKSKRLEDLTVKASQTSDYAQTDEVEEDTHSDSSLTNNMLPCGTDCNQIRTEIFRKVNTLMARAKPEKLHLKPRSKTPTFIDQDEDEGGTLTTGHQAVQTVFTENKKVQTRYNEPKQVQWAILPKDSLMNSPKVTRLVNENQKPPKEKILFRDDSILMPYNERQIFRDDSILMKVSIEPKREIYSKDSRHVSIEVESDGRAMNDSQVDSPYLSPTKRTKGQHHLLLYQEAMEIQKEQKDLERAREERRDFWSSYERELKRGRGLHVEEYEIERKGKRTIEEEETPRFVEDPAPMKTKLNAFLDEHLSLTSTSRASSSPQVGSKSSQEAAAIFQQLLDKVESYETSPKEDDLVGLQGLRKVESVDSLQCLEAMEKQLYPEIAHLPGQLSPTELDYMKAAILSHNFYPRLVTSFINQHKASAPPDQVERLERIRQQVIKSWRPLGKPAGNPAQQDKIKKYQDILTKFERELEKPFRDAMDFSWQMEHYLDTIPQSRGRSEIGSSGSNNLKDFNDEQDSST